MHLSPIGRSVVAGVLAVAAVLGASGCSEPGYKYVNNSDEGTFFRLPDSFEVFRVKEERPEGRPTASTPGGEQAWHVAFDSAPQPDVDHAGQDAPDHVTGQAIVFPLTATVGDAVSAVDLRSFFLGKDPVEL
ncbi:MAG TPA: hypothetical protein VF855_01975, partial [Acidimicrobiales bacterium]